MELMTPKRLAVALCVAGAALTLYGAIRLSSWVALMVVGLALLALGAVGVDVERDG